MFMYFRIPVYFAYFLVARGRAVLVAVLSLCSNYLAFRSMSLGPRVWN